MFTCLMGRAPLSILAGLTLPLPLPIRAPSLGAELSVSDMNERMISHTEDRAMLGDHPDLYMMPSGAGVTGFGPREGALQWDRWHGP
ncbi:hypothetical protein JB92DRAFT_1761879 [Gautieria morchelliformis]|nr:hypothetical protein JB92DRAFT_1761879 [Gautieria morchelliformis]